MSARSTAVAAAFLGAIAASAVAQNASDLTLHGFGGWAAGYSDNQNVFAEMATNEVGFRNYDFTLNLTARATETISLHAQAGWRSNAYRRDLQLDYTFVQWRPSSHLAVRIGKVKSPVALYTETFDVGTLRPFYLLPQSLYGAPGLSKAYLGAGVTGSFSLGRWDLTADVFGGDLELEGLYQEIPVGFDPASGMPILAVRRLDEMGHDAWGGRLSVAAPLRGLSVGFTAFKTDIETALEGTRLLEQSAHAVGAGVEYLTERAAMRAEYFKAGGDVETRHGYAEAAYKVLPKWQLKARYDYSTQGETATQLIPLPAAFREHRDWAFGVGYWASADVVFKVDYHHVKGNLFARPLNRVEALAAGGVDETTNVVVAGAQFSF